MQIKHDILYKKSGIGVAFDLGTTTIVGSLLDLSDGTVLASVSSPNPQSRWGSDVISRIEAVVREPGLLGELSRAAVGACNEIIASFPKSPGISEITLAGNTVMEHILLGVSPEPLSRPPYKPVFKSGKKLPAGDAGFNPGATLYTFPIIGGFVGGDAVAVALYLGLKNKSECSLAIDIGTNSEILLSADDTLYAASAAAGPAFEGGGIRCGMIAADGAIRGVSIEGESVCLDVIGKAPPKGICGSGLLDAASALIEAGIIDRTGRIKNRSEIPTNLSNRIKEGAGGNSFILHRSASGEVSLSQADIRALQVAKSSIRSGISVLLKKAGLDPGDIGNVYIAGAFGSGIKAGALKAIGIIDDRWVPGMVFTGDAALEGAVLALLSDDMKKEAEDIASSAKFVSLSGSAHFEREFIKNMNF